MANVTRQDARDFLELVKELKIQPRVAEFPLEGANEALRAMKDENLSGSAVIVIQDAPSSQRL